jgi:hypothetical protein
MTAVPSLSAVQKAAIVSFDTNEPATQGHIPQELILFGEFISYSEENTQYTNVHCMLSVVQCLQVDSLSSVTLPAEILYFLTLRDMTKVHTACSEI